MGLLAALVAAGAATPVVVLVLTTVLGCGVAAAVPCFSSLVPELVPRKDLAGAVTLNGVSINGARAIGPALARLVLAVLSATALFALQTALLVAIATLVLGRRSLPGRPPGRSEGVAAAMRTGLRFARTSRELQAVLVRGGAFVLPASAMWALLPVVAVRQLDLDPAAFGGLLAAVGAGAVAGAQLLPRLRARLGLSRLVVAGSACGVANLVALAVLHATVPVVVSLVVAGAAWIAVLSSLNTAAQLAALAHVRGRALSVNQLVFQGGMAAGSALWGVIAQTAGSRAALLAAAALLLATLPAARRWVLGASA